MTLSHDVGPDGLQLTAKEAAAQLRMSDRTLRRRRSEKKFPNEWKDQGRVRIPQDDVTAYRLAQMEAGKT